MTRLYLPGRDVENLDRLQEEYRHLPEGLPEVRVRTATQLDQTLRGGEREGEVKVEDASADDVLEILFEGGTTRWVSVATAMEELGIAATRGKRQEVRIPSTWGSTSKTRGGAGEMRVKEVRVLETHLPETIVELAATASVRGVAKYFENKLVKSGPGLYHYLKPNHLEKVVSPARLDRASPYLLFLHGTASSTVGSFGQLGIRHAGDTLKLGDSVEWEQLQARYPERMLGYEHRTFSESPIRNALELAELLPEQATLHLLSHSRGGLVGELLCLGQMEELLDPATASAKIEQLLRPWRETDREEDRQDLRALLTLLQKKRFKIDKFVRVACPARGTVALAGRLDLTLSLLLNLLGAIPVFSASPTYQVVKSLVLELVKRRTDPKVLPGIEAMMPGSPLVYMLNNLDLSTKSDLAVVAGDIEGGDLLHRLTVFLTDRFFREDHDLVVNCAAMRGGMRRKELATLYEDRGHEVSHFNYFRNLDTRSRIVRYLMAPSGDPQGTATIGFTPLGRGRGADRPATARQRATWETSQWTLFLLPGMMGSQLKDGARPVWLDPQVLGEEGREALRLDRHLEPGELLPGVYDRLMGHLGSVCRVVPFGYDWRQSLEVAARELARAVERELETTPHPVRFLGHSAGGLVVRAMIAMEPDLWRRVTERGGRLLMLGTPNWGSYWIAQLLVGEVRLAHQLAMLELGEEGETTLFRSFPGLLELLPESLLEWEGWEGSEPAQRPDRAALAEARRVRERLRRAGEGEERSSMLLVAGTAPLTPSGLRNDGAPPQFLAGAAGDGRVTHDQARLRGVRTWYLEASHGSLADQPAAFPALLELLEHGTTRRLSEVPFAWQAGEVLLDPEREIPSFFPTQEELIESALGQQEEREARPALRLSVLHGHLRDARSPILVGHYRDDAIAGAEAVIDARLGGQLSRLFQLGLYPGAEGTVEIFLPEARAGVEGAIVLGLGEMGELTREKLRQAVTQAAVRFGLHSAQQASGRGGEGVAETTLSLSTLLLGTYSNSQITVRESVQAILQGVIQANRLLERAAVEKEGETVSRVRIDALEVVELYEDIATQAAHAVRTILEDPPLDLENVRLHFDPACLRTTRGGRPQRPSDPFSSGWWRRVKITVDEAEAGKETPERRLRLTVLSDRARAEEEELITQRRLIDKLVERTIHLAEDDPALSTTLFELMVPAAYKDPLLSQGDLVLVVDGEAANYPWELMACRSRGEVRPIARGRGMIRQLLTPSPRTLRPSAKSRDLLVIGDPQLDDAAAQLPGARLEAELVAKQLSGDYVVQRMIGESPLAILGQLFEREYRIIHLAGHGYFDPEHPTNSGLLLGDGLWLGPAEFRQLRALPELVFLNCCHLGTMDGQGTPWNRLAASLAQELIGMGVKAVVAAGWAIDDKAALTFADLFYQQLLGGKGFGEAVRKARDGVYERHPQSNTWGAYQCYGIPDFKLHLPRRVAGVGRLEVQSLPLPLSRREAKDRLAMVLEEARESSRREPLAEWLDLLQGQLRPEWRDGEMLGLLGDCWAALGDFGHAVEAYRQAMHHPEGGASLRTLQQFANLLVRSMREKDLKRTEVRERLKEAERLLQILAELHPTTEALSLFGSLYKRWARQERLPKARRQRLRQARDQYQKAYQSSKMEAGEGDPYPGLNWLTCAYLDGFGEESPQGRAAGREPLPPGASWEVLAEIRDIAAEHRYADDLWKRVQSADAELLVALFEGGLDEPTAARLRLAYQEAIRGRADLREIDSVRDQFDFLLEMLPESAQVASLRQRLAEIQQSLWPRE